MAGLEADSNIRSRLAAIGLEPMADYISHGCQTGAIPGWIIVACSAMFTRYVDMVPQDETDLEGTPYVETTNKDDNLDNNQVVEYVKELEPCFRNTARFGTRCYGKHC